MPWLAFVRKPTPVELLLLRACGQLDNVLNLLERMEKHMANIDTATQDLTQLTTVGDSVVSLLGSLRKEVHDLKTAGTDPTTAAKIDALDATIRTKTAEWADAVKANTDAQDEPPVTPPTETPA